MDYELNALDDLDFDIEDDFETLEDDDFAVDQDFDFCDAGQLPAYMIANTGGFGHHSGW